MNTHFEINKLKRLIRENGDSYLFTSFGENEFGEPDPDSTEGIEICGVYHETQGYVTTVGSDGGNIKTKPDSQILCLFSSAKDLKTGMRVDISGKSYKLIDIRNIGNLGFACDLSLELILNGK